MKLEPHDIASDLWAGIRSAAHSLRLRPGSIGRLASLGLVVVLVVLLGFALWGAVSTYRSGKMARHETALSDAFEEARYAVGAEESLERKYRLEPSPEVRARHREAGEAMFAALKRARVLADVADITLIDAVVAKHGQYLAALNRMFDAVDAGDIARTNAIDGAEVDPVFGEIEGRVLAAAAARRASSDQHLKDLARLQTRVVVATPIVFAFGLSLVIFFAAVLRSYQAQVRNGAEREAEAAQRNERRFRALVQNASDVVLIFGPAGAVTYQSPAAETTWGYTAAGLLDRHLTAMVHPDDVAAARELWQQVLEVSDATRKTELRLRNAGGVWRYVELVLTNLLHEPSVAGVVATAHDIDERKALERQLTQQAFYDALTGLPNRALFRDRLDQALVRTGRRHNSTGLLFLDLDNFKLVNDSLGHHVGDELLVEAATRLQACVRCEDTVARLGGDEFVMLLEQLTCEADALPVVDSVRDQFSQPFALGGRNVVVTVSIGIALGDAHHEQADSLLRNADLAMYRAKASGKGRYVVFDPSMHTDTLARLELEADLRQALEREELRVYYQPIVPLQSEQVAEVEALVRWQHPTRGLISPADFIPIAEETGLIVPLGLWVLKEACGQTVAWNGQFPGEPLVVSVNLSPRQFQMTDLAEEVARTLYETGLPPSCLKLEITESAIMRDVEMTIATLLRLKALGIQLAIDDFGTGYSSLAYLKRLPLDVLKIDRAFVKGVHNNAEDKAIVQAILSLAKSLGLTVTAEGIESAEQAAVLNTWACDRGQGYYFAKPMDAGATAELLRADKRRLTRAQAA